MRWLARYLLIIATCGMGGQLAAGELPMEDRLNVEVELATWELLKQEPAAEAAGAEGAEP